jgi:chromosome segregation ATPase
MNDETQTGGNALETLPTERRAVVASGLAEFQAALHERARFKEERDELRIRLAACEAERDTLRDQLTQTRQQFQTQVDDMREHYGLQLNDAINRARALEAERDQAVADRSFVESVLQLVKGAIEKAEIPAPVSNRLRRQLATQKALNAPEGAVAK